MREAPLRSWESQKLDVPLVCPSVPDFSDFSRVVYVRVTDGTEQYRFEKAEKTVFEKTVQKQATLRNVLGKRNGLEPLFGALFEHFSDKIVNFFDVVVTW